MEDEKEVGIPIQQFYSCLVFLILPVNIAIDLSYAVKLKYIVTLGVVVSLFIFIPYGILLIQLKKSKTGPHK